MREADLSLRWTHMSDGTVSNVAALKTMLTMTGVARIGVTF